jgi:regulator of PEP synthase PpsR (kinase-PPPase family)
MEPHIVYFVSDHTGVTAEVLGQSLLARFEGIDVRPVTRPFVNSLERVEALVAELEALGQVPLVFSTIADRSLRERLSTAPGRHLDLFAPFLGTLEAAFGRLPVARPGAYHGIRDAASYQARIDAVEFALATDDGSRVSRYDGADVILVGVSRVGKSPTCLYLAMQYGVRGSNYPLADDDTEGDALPEALTGHRGRLFGLTVAPTRLAELRRQRRPGSDYASPEVCEREVRGAERLFRRYGVPYQDATVLSVEELAALILQRAGLERRH